MSAHEFVDIELAATFRKTGNGTDCLVGVPEKGRGTIFSHRAARLSPTYVFTLRRHKFWKGVICGLLGASDTVEYRYTEKAPSMPQITVLIVPEYDCRRRWLVYCTPGTRHWLAVTDEAICDGMNLSALRVGLRKFEKQLASSQV